MKIGFIDNFYHVPKGHCQVTNDLVKIFKAEGFQTTMFRIGGNQIIEPFIEPDTMYICSGLEVTEPEFRNWLAIEKPDWCVFNEYNQWFKISYDKLKVCKELGIKTLGYLVWERFETNKLDHYKLYNHILCPTKFQLKLFRTNGLYNSVYTPWAVDFSEIDQVTDPIAKKPEGSTIFYHCAGTGGVDNRKNTEAIIKAYEQIKDDNTQLIITHLNNQILSRTEIIQYILYSDIVINTSKWETIGLLNIESNACGRPVIVADAPPMNELITPNLNGMTVKCKMTNNSPNVTCPVCEIDIDDLAKKMMICKTRDDEGGQVVLTPLKRNSRFIAEDCFNWTKNKEYILNLVRI